MVTEENLRSMQAPLRARMCTAIWERTYRTVLAFTKSHAHGLHSRGFLPSGMCEVEIVRNSPYPKLFSPASSRCQLALTCSCDATYLDGTPSGAQFASLGAYVSPSTAPRFRGAPLRESRSEKRALDRAAILRAAVLCVETYC